jgi:hypothetical protein
VHFVIGGITNVRSGRRWHHRPELTDYPLVSMEPFTFTARDDLTIHGYLSFPAGVERTNLPAVLVVHEARGFGTAGGWIPRRSGSRTAATCVRT